VRDILLLFCLGDTILHCSGKTKWLKVVAISFCAVMLLCTLGARSCVGSVVLAQGITRPDSAEEAPETETPDEDSRLVREPVFYVCMTCGIICAVLWYARRLVVVAYGYGHEIRFHIGGYDRRYLWEIAGKQTSERRRWLFSLINILVPVFWIATVLVGLLGYMVIPMARAMIERLGR